MGKVSPKYICDTYFLDRNDYISMIKLYHKTDRGIVGIIMQTKNNVVKTAGDVTGTLSIYEFNVEKQFIGFDAILTKDYIASLSLISEFTVKKLCVSSGP